MEIFAEIVVSALILIGALFLFVGSFGLVKLPDLMRRLHAPTKATTLGVGALLIASLAYFLLVRGEASVHELMITVFLFLTAPVSALMLAKAHILRHHFRENLAPPAGENRNWATLGPVELPAGFANGEDPLSSLKN